MQIWPHILLVGVGGGNEGRHTKGEASTAVRPLSKDLNKMLGMQCLK